MSEMQRRAPWTSPRDATLAGPAPAAARPRVRNLSRRRTHVALLRAHTLNAYDLPATHAYAFVPLRGNIHVTGSFS
jgi:hypothetical protein